MPWLSHPLPLGDLVVWSPVVPTTEGAILFLHDLDGVTPFDRESWRTLIEASSLPVICPRAGRTWWLPVATPGFEIGPLNWVVQAIVPWIEQELGIRPPRLAVIGVGMGGGGALNLAFRHARKIPVVAAISPAIDFHEAQEVDPLLGEVFATREAARQQTPTLHLHPLNWPLAMRMACDPSDPLWFDGCERLASKLDSSSIPYDRDFTTTTGGNREAYDAAQLRIALEYVREKLPHATRQLEIA